MHRYPEHLLQTVKIGDATYREMRTALDVPGDVTYRDTLPADGDSHLDRLTRLAARAIIEGVMLYHIPGDPTVYATSSHGHRLYRIDTKALTCNCPASGLCKHLSLWTLATGSTMRLVQAGRVA